MDDVPLRDYLDSMLTEHQRMHEELAKGITVALQSVDARLQGMNEFRRSISDLVNNTVARSTYEAGHSALEQRVEQVAADMRERMDKETRTANNHVDRDVFDTRAMSVDKEVRALAEQCEQRAVALERAVDARLKSLENWRSKAAGAAIIATLFAGVIGAAVVRALGGG